MSRKSWKKGYDFEKGRQAHRDERKFEAGLGRAFEVLGSGAIGGILFILFVLLALASVIDSLDQSDEIAAEKIRMEREDIENSIKQWVLRTNLIDEFPPCEDYYDINRTKSVAETLITVENHIDKEYRGIRFCQIVAKEGDICTNIVVRFNTPFFGDRSEQLILHSVDAGDSWEVVWRSDKNEYAEIRSGPNDIKIISEDEIRISFLGERTNMYTDELKKFELYTLNGGNTWKFRRIL